MNRRTRVLTQDLALGGPLSTPALVSRGGFGGGRSVGSASRVAELRPRWSLPTGTAASGLARLPEAAPRTLGPTAPRWVPR